MANEPERPIEKLLRAAAKKRRDEAGAPLELHPANRRLWQGEVARTFARPKRETRSFTEALGWLWPRLAWGVAISAVLVVAVYVLLPVPGKSKSAALLAKNERMHQAAPAKQPLPPPPEAAATVSASPVAAVEANPSAVASAETAPPAAVQPAGQIEAERLPLPKDSLTAPTDREAKEKPVSAATYQLADRKQAAEAESAASGGTLAQATAGTANAAYNRQLGLGAKPVPPASAPAAPAAPPPVATMPAAAPVVAANEPAEPTGEKAGQPSMFYALPGAVASARRSTPSSAVTDGPSHSTDETLRKLGSVSVAQRFTQVAPGPKTKSNRADKAASAHPVLASFDVEQAGRELRIVDGDGSVYNGYVEIADAVRGRRSIVAAAPAAAPAPGPGGVLGARAAAWSDSDQPVPPTYYFRVAGTNRSLHKKVVFTGNLLAATNVAWFQPVTNNLSYGSGFGAVRNGSHQPDLLPLLNTRISGKVVVGNGKAVEINALPTKP
jgi:hypothetical protein